MDWFDDCNNRRGLDLNSKSTGVSIHFYGLWTSPTDFNPLLSCMQCVINLPKYFARQKAFATLVPHQQQRIDQVLMELNVIAESGTERNLCSLRGMQNMLESIVLKSVNENVKKWTSYGTVPSQRSRRRWWFNLIHSFTVQFRNSFCGCFSFS